MTTVAMQSAISSTTNTLSTSCNNRNKAPKSSPSSSTTHSNPSTTNATNAAIAAFERMWAIEESKLSLNRLLACQQSSFDEYYQQRLRKKQRSPTTAVSDNDGDDSLFQYSYSPTYSLPSLWHTDCSQTARESVTSGAASALSSSKDSLHNNCGRNIINDTNKDCRLLLLLLGDDDDGDSSTTITLSNADSSSRSDGDNNIDDNDNDDAPIPLQVVVPQKTSPSDFKLKLLELLYFG